MDSKKKTRTQIKKEKEAEEEKNNPWSWNQEGSLIYGCNGAEESEKIAGFDMDSTLIKTKSGARFPKTADDWIFWDNKVESKLKKLYNEKYKIIIFTNQNGISKGHLKKEDITKKIEQISATLNIKMQALVATEDDNNKKPGLGMWEFLVKNMNGKTAIDKKKSFFCGDAAGRKGPPKDFSDTDLKFALNLGVEFYVPEKLFLEQEQTIEQDFFDPKTLPKDGSLFKEGKVELERKTQEMIVYCGSPGSGKSTFWKNYLSNYVRVNRDTLKTKEKCLKVAEEAIVAKKSCVIDNTNPAPEDRKIYIDLAKKYNIPVRCFYFECPKELCFHLNNQRQVNTSRKHLSGKIPKIPIHSWYKNSIKPKKDEGFEGVYTVNFIAGPFDNKQDEELFYSLGGK